MGARAFLLGLRVTSSKTIEATRTGADVNGEHAREDSRERMLVRHMQEKRVK